MEHKVIPSIGTWPSIVPDIKTQCSHQDKIRLISQLITDISGVLQNFT